MAGRRSERFRSAELVGECSRLAHQTAPTVADDVNKPAAFATALLSSILGESRTSTLMNEADADYLLAVRDAQEVPTPNRADLAMLIRDGYLSIYPDATIRPRESLSRAELFMRLSESLRRAICCNSRKAMPVRRSRINWSFDRRKEKTFQSRLIPTRFCFDK